MDELAIAAGIDPIELRIRNEPDDRSRERRAVQLPQPRRLPARGRRALRLGRARPDARARAARGAGWSAPASPRSTYPAYRQPSQASARAERTATLHGARSPPPTSAPARAPSLTQIAADALGVAAERVRVEIGDSDAARAPSVAGGSMGTASWGSAVRRGLPRCASDWHRRRTDGRARPAPTPPSDVAAAEALSPPRLRRAVRRGRGSTRTPARSASPRMLGVFAAGRIVNPHDRPLAAHRRHDHGAVDGAARGERHGRASSATTSTTTSPQYHVPACADVARHRGGLDRRATTRTSTRSATKGIGEIGIVGTAAAIANAVHHATGVRVRDLPIRLDRLLGRM